MARTYLRLFVTALLLVPGLAAAQSQQQTPPPPPPPPAQTTAGGLPVPALPVRPDINSYVVGPDDTLKIEIFLEDRLPKEFKVGPDGVISFPYIGDVKVAGLDVRAVVAEIKRRLVEGKFLLTPQITADVTAYRSQLVMVQGQVNQPGDIMLEGFEMTLTRALSKAQISPLAASYVEIHRRRPGTDPLDMRPENFETMRVERRALDAFLTDPRLYDGDRVFVPKAPLFFITGHVKAGGNQVWVPGMTVGKAIAAAGGLSERGTNRGLKIKRMVNGKFKEFPADENTVVLPEDQIIVKQRRF